MFYQDITVDLPSKKRIRRTNTNISYVYEILSRKDKKGNVESSRCVGILTSDNRMHPNEIYYDLHSSLISNKPLDNPFIFSSSISIGAQLMFRKISKDLGIANLLKEIFKGSSELIESIIEYYLIRRDNAIQLYEYYLFDNYSLLNFIPSDSTLSNLFNDKITHEKINLFLTTWLNMKVKSMNDGAIINIDFDSTNRNFYSKNVESAEYGHSKDDEGLPLVNVAYFLDRDTGLPLYYDVYYGSIIDMNHCKTAINKIKTINSSINASFIMDRGYFSVSNLDFFSDNNLKFICMGKTNKKYEELIDEYENTILNVENRVYKTIYGIKTKGKINASSKYEYNIYLYRDTQFNAYELSDKYDYIDKIVEMLIGKKDESGQIENTYSKYVKIEKDENNIITNVTPNYEYIEDYKRKLGYFYIVSNEDLSLKEIYSIYKNRDIIEKGFKYSKSGMSLNKLYASCDNMMESKTFMSFLGTIYRAYINKTCEAFLFQNSSETTQTIIEELGKIKIERLTKDKKYSLRYALTSKQSQILSHFRLNKKDVINALNDFNASIELTNQ